jgi:serine phosphatase RsbU (regulator of sigma subunit)
MMARTIDDLAGLSEEPAVRRRFDLRNVVVARWIQFGFFWFFFGATLTSASRGAYLTATLAAGCLLTVLLLLLTFRRIAPSRMPPRAGLLAELAGRIEPWVRAFILVYLVLQYPAVLLIASASMSFFWFIIYPLLVIAFRFDTSERILVHSLLLGLVAIGSLGQWAEGRTDLVLPGILVSAAYNAIALGIGLWLTRRFRRSFLEEWSVARQAHQERARMRQELDFARELQLAMLPRETPQVPWLDIAALSLPASEVGGDYYDFFELDRDRLVVVVGDVAGHGLASGIVLSGVRSCLTLLSEDLRDPVAVIERLHRMVRHTARHRMLVTLSILLLDHETGQAVLTSAGHPPILLRRGTGQVEEIGISSLPLGATLLETFETRTFPVGEGDVLLLQTDGVYETSDDEGEQFGLDRLVERLEAHDPTRGSSTLRDAILRDLWEFRGSAAQQDDLTMVTLTWRSGAAS